MAVERFAAVRRVAAFEDHGLPPLRLVGEAHRPWRRAGMLGHQLAHCTQALAAAVAVIHVHELVDPVDPEAQRTAAFREKLSEFAALRRRGPFRRQRRAQGGTCSIIGRRVHFREPALHPLHPGVLLEKILPTYQRVRPQPAPLEALAGRLSLVPFLFPRPPGKLEVVGKRFFGAQVVDQPLPRDALRFVQLRHFRLIRLKGRFVGRFADHRLVLGLHRVVEDGIQRIIVLRRDRVRLVIVATRAGHRARKEAAGHHVHAVVDRFHLPSAQPDGEKSQCCEVRVIRPIHQMVRGDLELHEALVRQIRIKGLDQPIAVGVGEGIAVVLVEMVATGVGVSGHIHPVPGPALAIGRAGQELVDQGFPRRLVGRRYDPPELLVRGRQTGQ